MNPEMPRRKLTVFAMTEKGFAVVESLLSLYPGLVAAVISARDKGIAKDHFREIQDLCGLYGIPFHHRSEAPPLATEFALAVSWRWLMDTGPARLIVFHDSLLPRYRGFNPLVSALLNGDAEIGVTALYANGEYDQGDIIAQSSSAIKYPIRIQEAIGTVLGNYRALAGEVGAALSRGEAPPARPQDEGQASYSLWRDEADYLIDWTRSANYLKRFVDAMGHPYKGAATYMEGKPVRILDAEPLYDIRIENRTPGKVVFSHPQGPVVVCGEGLLRIIRLVDDASGDPLLPLSRFRTRFGA